jgi:hypothetical protein
MPQGKPSMQMCIHLDPVTRKCAIWGTNDYPKFCRGFKPELDFCGNTREEAHELLAIMEIVTKPA